MSEGALKCNKCGTKNGQGVNYCNMCGYHTTIKTEFCFNCGAKQHNIVSQKMKEERIKELQKKLKLNKKMMDIEKVTVQ
jgi:predicted amidophosphoribosyltransferase